MFPAHCFLLLGLSGFRFFFLVVVDVDIVVLCFSDWLLTILWFYVVECLDFVIFL